MKKLVLELPILNDTQFNHQCYIPPRKKPRLMLSNEPFNPNPCTPIHEHKTNAIDLYLNPNNDPNHDRNQWLFKINKQSAALEAASFR